MSQMFGRYTMVGQLGKGAMGVVYLAEDPLLNRKVALKTVDLALDDPDEREFLRNRLMRDARAAAVLKHPNIVSVYDFFGDSGRGFVVMEYVEGESLAARLRANPLPDTATILRVLGQMADALDYTHAHGVIHRDIKPANVMIDAGGTAKIMDFGIARINDTRTCTPTGMVIGTAEYMAPEQIRGDAIDGRADQFALAVVAYQMMTGSTLFGPSTLATLTYKIIHETPPPPCTRNPALPSGVDAVLGKALAKTSSERFANCREFVGALAQAYSSAPTIPLSPAPIIAPKPTGQATAFSEPAGPARRSHSAWLAVAVGVVCIGGALAVWKPWSRTPPLPTHVATVTPADAASVPTGEPATEHPVAPPEPQSHEASPTKVQPNPPIATHPRDAAKPAEPPPQPQAAAGAPTVAAGTAAPGEPMEEVELAPVSRQQSKTGAAPSPFEEAVHRAQEEMKARDYAGAIQSYNRAISLRPKNALAYFNRGVAQQNLEQNEMALQSYSEAIRLAPDMARAYSGRGVCLVRLRRDQEAFGEFQKALELRSDLAPALNGRGGVYFRRKEYRLALADYDAAIRSNPQFAPAYMNRARAREVVGDFRGAAADRQREADLRKR